jgi:hypothetical protein
MAHMNCTIYISMLSCKYYIYYFKIFFYVFKIFNLYKTRQVYSWIYTENSCVRTQNCRKKPKRPNRICPSPPLHGFHPASFTLPSPCKRPFFSLPRRRRLGERRHPRLRLCWVLRRRIAPARYTRSFSPLPAVRNRPPQTLM